MGPGLGTRWRTGLPAPLSELAPSVTVGARGSVVQAGRVPPERKPEVGAVPPGPLPREPRQVPSRSRAARYCFWRAQKSVRRPSAHPGFLPEAIRFPLRPYIERPGAERCAQACGQGVRAALPPLSAPFEAARGGEGKSLPRIRSGRREERRRIASPGFP